MRLPSPLLIVTDRHQAWRPLAALVGDALAAGARWFWLRDRDLPGPDRADLAGELAQLSRGHGATLSIGADIALAAEIGTGAVHVADARDVAEARRQLGPGALVGVSAHGIEDVRRAAAAGADYACLSPIFATASKPGYGPPLGIAAIGRAAGAGIAVLALGGITPARAADCARAGAAGVAVMGGVWRAADTGAAVAALLQAVGGDHRP